MILNIFTYTTTRGGVKITYLEMKQHIVQLSQSVKLFVIFLINITFY